MAPDGTLYALTSDGKLQRRLPNAQQWGTLDTGVQSFAMQADGTVYELNDRLLLRRLQGRSNWATLDTGVQTFELTAAGDLFELNVEVS